MPMEILFENELGKVQLTGSINPLLSPVEITGLNLPEKEITAAKFKMQAGQKLISSRDKPRTIKISGMLEGNLPKAARLLYLNGTITIKTERMLRVISARCTEIINYANENKITISFVCDNPYFHDGQDLKIKVYSRINLVSSPFTLPCTFTNRIRKGNCKNESVVLSEPEIFITNKGKTTAEGFIVTNQNTGAKLELNCEIPPDTAVFVNIKDRTVYSSNGENLLPALSSDCYLHEFTLAPGDNILSLLAQDGIECEVIYNTNYTEAVI